MPLVPILALLLIAACAASPRREPTETPAVEARPDARTGTVAVIRPLGGMAAEVVVREDKGGLVAVVLRDASALGVGDRVRLEAGALRRAP